jgi:ferredoxin-NADP reductase
MCSTDSKGRILKENFFPISSSSMQGSFEILVRRSTGGGSYDKFVRSVDSLEQGDEIAFKGGSYRLNYRGKDDPIKFVTVVSTGVGIAPSLQILNGILSDKDSTVEDMELLWMNSDNRDFVCDKDVATLKKKYDKKLFISKVNVNKLFEQDFTQMDEILGALSPHEPNRIAVICGSIDMVTKVKDLLMVVGYPEESVLSIAT